MSVRPPTLLESLSSRHANLALVALLPLWLWLYSLATPIPGFSVVFPSGGMGAIIFDSPDIAILNHLGAAETPANDWLKTLPTNGTTVFLAGDFNARRVGNNAFILSLMGPQIRFPGNQSKNLSAIPILSDYLTLYPEKKMETSLEKTFPIGKGGSGMFFPHTGDLDQPRHFLGQWGDFYYLALFIESLEEWELLRDRFHPYQGHLLIDFFGAPSAPIISEIVDKLLPEWIIVRHPPNQPERLPRALPLYLLPDFHEIQFLWPASQPKGPPKIIAKRRRP